nr:MAG TPA: hypothetical protein [Caudoviricetes sp.]
MYFIRYRSYYDTKWRRRRVFSSLNDAYYYLDNCCVAFAYYYEVCKFGGCKRAEILYRKFNNFDGKILYERYTDK